MLVLVPARRLAKDDFVDAAVRLMESAGHRSITLKEVGDAVGANITAVYRYFPSKEALMAAVVDRVLDGIVDPTVRLKDPRRELDRVAREMRRIQVAYPAVAATLAGTDVIAPSSIQLSRIVIENLVALGLEGDDLVITYQALENFVIGSGSNDGLGVVDNWEIRRARYEVIGREYFAEVSSSEVAELSQAAYLHGVSVLLDAAQERTKSR